MDTLVKKKKKYGNLIFYCCLLAFPMLQFAVFYVGVNVNSVLLAFSDIDAITGARSYAGLSHFVRLFNDLGTTPVFRYGLKNSLIAFAFSLLIGVSLALFFSYYIYKKRFAHNFFKVILFAPSVISALVLVTMFRYFADTFIPTILNKLFGTHFLGLLTEFNTIFPTLLVYSLWIGFGTPILMYVGAMNGIPQDVSEAAQLDGAGPFREFFQIVLPQIFSTLSVFVITSVAGIFTNQLNLFSFYSHMAENQYYTIGYFLYVRVILAQGFSEYPYLAAFGLLITVVTAPVVLILRAVLKKLDPMEG